MFKKLGILLAPLLLFSGLALGGVAFAATPTPDPGDPLGEFCRNTDAQTDTTICDINEADKTNADTKGLLAKNGIIKRVLGLMSWLVGMLAVIFIIVGGFKFTTSGGNSDSVKSAKNMIIYACVGIAVVILSQVIINFVIGLANKASG